MKRGEKRLLDFLFFFFGDEIFSKFVAQKAPLELPFLSILFLRRRAARLSA